MNYIKIIKSLKDLGNISETVIHEIKKKQEGKFPEALLAPLVASLLQSVISSVVKGISGDLEDSGESE